MRKTLLPMLLAGVVMPFAAFAQDTQAPATGTAPSMTDESKPAEMTEPAAPDAAATPDSTATDTTTSPADTSGTAAMPEADTGSDMAATPDSEAGADMASAEGPFVTVEPTGSWRASDLEGKEVYDTTGENIGSISDVLLSEQGEVLAVLVGVGGFLGIGEKDVAVSMDALEFGPGKTEGLPTEAEVEATADAAAPAAPAAGGMAADPAAPAGGAETTASTTEPVTPVVGEDNLPDRIVLNVTREELESAPAYGEEADDMDSDDAAATGAAPTTPATDSGMAPASNAPAQ
ncbi:PRC-barrel domain-containing protein [Aurantimonas sp. HBX-1]|uniref:PRC-barrel domain-containing protein n=1 Tax=Aurantimonas sp. HBX-1 TaxID=2906072 RepID=UPI001F38C8C2|nr:PRC-barrel domain-containing protein [Aurantimonas sp. HBX-1]UIJ71850.1 PRC-barrel domain-containing protein [Aurantimonas sp. HBX-1]